MALTNLQVQKSAPKEKPYKLSDSKGMYLYVTPKNQKYWRMDYRFGGKRKTLALGVFPETSLTKARERRDDARKLLGDDLDPSLVKRVKKIAAVHANENSFKAVAVEWYEKEKPLWSESHTVRMWRMLSKDLFPFLGHRPINEITSPELLAQLRKIESRGAIETAHRVKQAAGQVFRYGIVTGRCERDLSADLKGALTTPKHTHYAAITDPRGVGKLLVAVHGYEGTPEVQTAMKIHPYLFARTVELRHMEWSEIDWDAAEWHIPAQKMKMKQPHIVPLPTQVIDLLKELQPITGNRQYVFPSARSPRRAMSDNAMLGAMRRMGIAKEEMTPHGYRAIARTLLDEELGYRVDWIECQLAHRVIDANGRAYNRTKYLRQRKDMMQHWADYLDSLKAAALNGNVIAGAFKKIN